MPISKIFMPKAIIEEDEPVHKHELTDTLKANPFTVGQVVVCCYRNHHVLKYGQAYVVSEIVHGPYTWNEPRVKIEGFGRKTFLVRRFKSVTDVETTNYSIPAQSQVPQESEGFELFSKKLTPIEPAVDDPIRDWKRRVELKKLRAQADDAWKRYGPGPKTEPVEVCGPKPGPDLTGIERAKDANTRDGLILAAVRGTEVKR